MGNFSIKGVKFDPVSYLDDKESLVKMENHFINLTNIDSVRLPCERVPRYIRYARLKNGFILNGFIIISLSRFAECFEKV